MAEDIGQMQKQAARRVMEMQERSRRAVEENARFAAEFPAAMPQTAGFPTGMPGAAEYDPSSRTDGTVGRSGLRSPGLFRRQADPYSSLPSEWIGGNAATAAPATDRASCPPPAEPACGDGITHGGSGGEPWLLWALAFLLMRAGGHPELTAALIFLAL